MSATRNTIMTDSQKQAKRALVYSWNNPSVLLCSGGLIIAGEANQQLYIICYFGAGQSSETIYSITDHCTFLERLQWCTTVALATGLSSSQQLKERARFYAIWYQCPRRSYQNGVKVNPGNPVRLKHLVPIFFKCRIPILVALPKLKNSFFQTILLITQGNRRWIYASTGELVE